MADLSSALQCWGGEGSGMLTLKSDQHFASMRLFERGNAGQKSHFREKAF
jgi:hypothetical protein